MEIKIGKLNFESVLEHKDLVAESTFETISSLHNNDNIGVVEIDPNFSDTVPFCEQYQTEADKVANCVVLEAKRGDRSWFAACVVSSDTKADVNGLARRTLDARKVSFAPMEKAVSETGMEYGGICPIGLPGSWPILIDKSVADLEYIVIGSGIRKSKIAISGKTLASLPNTKVLENLGQKRS